MADEDHSDTQQFVSDNHENPSKFNFGFIYKAIIVSIVLVLLPLFPSQAPEFVNQAIPDRSWELVHLLFVGIAVSYGLFSRRNVDNVNETTRGVENTQAYMSRMLSVSSVFDDDFQNPSRSSDDNNNHLVQTWNSRYLRGESNVNLVAQADNSGFDEQINHRRNVSVQPLLLPVRSLRSQMPDSHFIENQEEYIDESVDRNVVNGEVDELGPSDLDEKNVNGHFVLPSPKPWRSRSGRMVMNEQVNAYPPSVEDSELNQHNYESVRTPIYFPRPNQTTPSMKFGSVLPSISPKLRSENFQVTENFNIPKSSSLPIQSQSLYNNTTTQNSSLVTSNSVIPKSSSLPIQSQSNATQKSSLVTSNSSPMMEEFLLERETKRSSKDQKDLRRRSRENLDLQFPKPETIQQSLSIVSHSDATTNGFAVDKDIKRSRQKELRRRSREELGLDFLKPEAKSSENSSSITLDTSAAGNGYSLDEKDMVRDEENFGSRSSTDKELALSSSKSRTRGGGSSKGKSVRTIRAIEQAAESRRVREVNGDQLDGKNGIRAKEIEAVPDDKMRKRGEGADSLPLGNGKSSYESSQPSPTFSRHQKKHKKKLSEKVILETEEYSGSELDERQGGVDTVSDNISHSNSGSNEVDKKADEFIAKFREQIRLQKVETTRRSNGKQHTSTRILSR
ncbi:micronuclear linker histone polyprotein-like [Papaver somniferum]|uniref:micronuclear linker histone polyprotein-like n=1 Tax=Papaver somniferum TaxID=3469 RepID=UPI000E6F6425|nr:micronuclear linker histone polyprotein-like [Papaver somniferum]